MAHLVARLYPRACDKRLAYNDPVLVKARHAFFKATGSNFLLLQLLFLGLFCYVFGSLFLQTNHTHNIRFAFVDYDTGGAIGEAVRRAYSQLRQDSFPTLVERSPADLQTPTDLREAVCRTKYWAALYVSPGASGRLQVALAAGNGSGAATPYDKDDVMTYIWNEAVYSPVVDQAVSASIQALSAAARVAYSLGGPNGTANLQSVSGPAALSVLADPWHLRSVDIQPTTQGSRAIYNTLVIILILIQEFFYLGTINGLYAQFKIYARVPAHRIVVVRNLNSLSYTLVGSLCTAGAIWAFRNGWNVDGGQFALTWMALWLFAHLNFLTLDVFTIWLPAPFVPMALISWVVFNVTSILLPFDLSPRFYRVGYVFPAHDVYQVLTDIWSGGCNPQLRYALPILFSWEVLGLVLGGIGVFRRCHFTTLAEENQAREFKERLDDAVDFQMKELREKRRLGRSASTATGATTAPVAVPPAEKPPSISPGADTEAEAEEDEEDRAEIRQELSQVMSHADARRRHEQRQERMLNFGPSFSLAFNHERDESDSDKESRV